MCAFPALDSNFYDILSDRLFANKYCNERLNKAVEHVIDTCEYPTPTIAKFISFDKHIKLYNYKQMHDLRDEVGQHIFEKFYKTVRIAGLDKPMWANINDIEKYNLELWKKN